MAWLPEEWKKIIISIEELNEEKEKEEYTPVGTAFLIDYKSVNILVTCKHILMNSNLDRLFLSFNTVDHQIHRISFNQLITPPFNWVMDQRDEIDIAIIPINLNFQKWDIGKLGENMFAPYEELFEGDEIFFLGFPLGIKSLSRVHPLVRQGIIAFKHENGPFLIDAHVYPGNSGSPVFLKPSVVDFDGSGNATIGQIKPPKLIGIISSYIPYIDPCISVQTNRPRITFEENSGLANVFPIDLIMGIIQSKNFQQMISGLIAPEEVKDNIPEREFKDSSSTNIPVRKFEK